MWFDIFKPVVRGGSFGQYGCISISCVRPLLCPFYEDGQFQGLRVWDGQKVRLSRLFYLLTSTLERRARRHLILIYDNPEADFFDCYGFCFCDIVLCR